MSKYDELKTELDKAADEYNRRYELCRMAGVALANGLSDYLGVSAVGYFNWEEDDASEKQPIRKALEWDQSGTKMILGILVHVESGSAFNYLGYRIELEPSGESVHVTALDGQIDLYLRKTGVGETMDIGGSKEAAFESWFKEIKASVSGSFSRESKPRNLIGFR